MDNHTIIKIDNIKKIYTGGLFRKRKVTALNGVSLSIKKGEIFGILGPNGAGKTTLLNILMGQILADDGKISIMGYDTTKRLPDFIKKRMNMCSGNPNFPWSLTIYEALKFYGMLYGFYGKSLKTKVEYLIEQFKLTKYRNTQYDELSTGNKQKLALAKALLNDPEILLLDEPTIGLDPDVAKRTRQFIKDLHKKTKITILLTTHYMREAEELCDRIAFINEGEIKALGTKERLKKITKTKSLEEAFIALAN
ncbi:MAG: ABC transporter ATP-binding protein [Candidatus Goldbacteria bacterium]|nr:ABC transporter ATP-binding protein [Candidatus Goldiibacteriota bacterium]